METDRRVHIISAGENVHNTFPTANNKISHATKLYVIVEENVCEKSNVKFQKTSQAIIDSIKKLKEIADPFVRDGVEVVRIADDTLDNIRDAVFDLYKKDKDAEYYLNVSGGTKGLSIGLFMMALWIEAIPYHIDKNGNARVISIPKVHMGDFKKNPNRITILEILSSKQSKSLSRKELKQELDERYKPVKDNRSKKAKRSLSYGGFHSLIEDLLEWKLIGQKPHKNSRKEKEYYITEDGEFTL